MMIQPCVSVTLAPAGMRWRDEVLSRRRWLVDDDDDGSIGVGGVGFADAESTSSSDRLGITEGVTTAAIEMMRMIIDSMQPGNFPPANMFQTIKPPQT